MRKNKILFVFCFIFLFSCSEKNNPKPKGYVRLEYPKAIYQNFKENCNYTFQYSTFSQIEQDSACWYNLNYKNMNAKLYLTYYNLHNSSLEKLIKQSEKIVYEHTIKAASIEPKLFVNENHNVYGTFYELTGEAATNYQFYVTDSTKHFLQGSFYFRTKPKPDSIKPAAKYIKKDLFHLIETLQWKN